MTMSSVQVVFLLLTKTGPPVTKNFPLLDLFLSAAMMARRFYTPYDANCTILTARGMSHIFYSNWLTSKQDQNYCALVRSPNSKITN